MKSRSTTGNKLFVWSLDHNPRAIDPRRTFGPHFAEKAIFSEVPSAPN